MGKRLARDELLQEIKVEREALNALLKQIKPRQMTVPGVTPGGWSVKDILAHVAGWQGKVLEWHEAEQRGETPAVPAPGLTWRDLMCFNESIYQEHRRRSPEAVLLDYEVFHNRMIALIENTPDADLVAVADTSGWDRRGRSATIAARKLRATIAGRASGFAAGNALRVNPTSDGG